MKLYNDTLLRSFLAHLQSVARKRAALTFEAVHHADATTESRLRAATPNPDIAEMWESLRRDILKVLHIQLVPYNELAKPGTFTVGYIQDGHDQLRITLKALKLKADKARRSDSSITLLRSWDISAKDRPPDVEAEEAA